MSTDAIDLCAPISSVVSAITRWTSAEVLAAQSFLLLKSKNHWATISIVGSVGAAFNTSPGIGGRSTAVIPANQGSLGTVSWDSPRRLAANILTFSILARRTALQANWNA